MARAATERRLVDITGSLPSSRCMGDPPKNNLSKNETDSLICSLLPTCSLVNLARVRWVHASNRSSICVVSMLCHLQPGLSNSLYPLISTTQCDWHSSSFSPSFASTSLASSLFSRSLPLRVQVAPSVFNWLLPSSLAPSLSCSSLSYTVLGRSPIQI